MAGFAQSGKLRISYTKSALPERSSDFPDITK